MAHTPQIAATNGEFRNISRSAIAQISAQDRSRAMQ
jgi:hypothetical protein